MMNRRSVPLGLETADLVNWGIEGLVKAYKNFKSEKGSKFSTYAHYRIRGEIADKIRIEWRYRNPNKYQDYRKQVQERIADLVEASLDAGKDVDMGLIEESAYQSIASASMACLLSIDALEEQNVEIEMTVKEESKLSQLWEEVNSLTEEEQIVIDLCYKQDLKQTEIAEKMNLSKSKVCRIHIKALEKLKKRLEKNESE
jgi:RNA polymerase sigma factor for flagellar operon FliA